MSLPKNESKYTGEWHCWRDMKRRCYDESNRAYKWYGARGIQVCEAWRNSYQQFLSDMGRRPSREYTLDRKDTNGDYCPDNCRWATWKDQQRNKSANRILTFNGATRCVAEWAEVLGISRSVISRRLGMGWTTEESLAIPVHRCRANPTVKRGDGVWFDPRAGKWLAKFIVKKVIHYVGFFPTRDEAAAAVAARKEAISRG